MSQVESSGIGAHGVMPVPRRSRGLACLAVKKRDTLPNNKDSVRFF